MSLRSTYTPTTIKGGSGERSSGRHGSGSVAGSVETADKKAKKIDWSSLPEIWALMHPRRGILLLGLLLTGVNTLAGLVLPLSSKFLFDNVINKRQVQLLLPLVLQSSRRQQSKG